MKPELRKGSRSRYLAGALFVIATIFVIRLFYLQIIQHGHYVELANAEQVKKETIPATRGEIYALNGSTPVKLVLNQNVYTVFVDPVEVTDKAKLVSTMNAIAGGNVRDNFASLIDDKQSRYQVIATRVSYDQAQKIKAVGLKGIGFQAISQRVYPEGSLASQVLGFVNADGVGNYGVEGYLNDELKGVDGRLQTVTDVSDVPLTIGNDNVRVPAQNGKNVVLTIDRNVQAKVEQALADGVQRSHTTNASAVVLDPHTGRIMAMANVPTYDPSQYYNVTDASLFNNDVISAPYEPGSDVKTYTMATAIDKGVAKASDTYDNTDYIKVEDITISNATKGHTGVISFQTALDWSLNTGFVTIAERLGDGKNITKEARDTMYEYFHDRLHLGQLTGVELANESPGIIISPNDVQGNAVRYSNMSFGQGLDATMLQVASGFSAIINGGNYYKSTVVDGTISDDGTFNQAPTPQPIETGAVKESTSQQILDMTHTARSSGFPHIDKPGYYVGGKTGTSQVIVNGQYSNTETIGTYLGYGGNSPDNPQYVIMVTISGKDKIMGGAQDAMPIFTDISNWMLDYLKIQPKG
ncbi:MAG TPA: penicillin-binding protein 2 [Dongiaceae bacterium]|nr:penicillin-binding protein 2 [Dongiaceae bacterium]